MTQFQFVLVALAMGSLPSILIAGMAVYLISQLRAVVSESLQFQKAESLKDIADSKAMDAQLQDRREVHQQNLKRMAAIKPQPLRETPVPKKPPPPMSEELLESLVTDGNAVDSTGHNWSIG